MRLTGNASSTPKLYEGEMLFCERDRTMTNDFVVLDLNACMWEKLYRKIEEEMNESKEMKKKVDELEQLLEVIENNVVISTKNLAALRRRL